MSIANKINYNELIDIVKKIDHPFSREVYIGTIKKELGKGFSIWYDMGNGIAFFARSFILKEDTILVEESDVSSTVFIFNLAEKIPFIYKDNKELLLKNNNFLIALASNEFSVQTSLTKNKCYTTLSIGMKEELFFQLAQPLKNIEKYKEKVKKNSYAIFQEGKIDPKQFEILNYLNKDEKSYENLFKNLSLESKTTDLIHYTIEKTANSLNKVANLNLDTNKINSLEKAKNIILNEYHKPLSIKEIAYKSAINECYLKKDFKAYYGMTIYEMLQNHRMKSAKELLQKDFGVKEVALKVGYKHSGNFSKIFFKYFAITPSNYKKEFV